jgi:hypothetical protein
MLVSCARPKLGNHTQWHPIYLLGVGGGDEESIRDKGASARLHLLFMFDKHLNILLTILAVAVVGVSAQTVTLDQCTVNCIEYAAPLCNGK